MSDTPAEVLTELAEGLRIAIESEEAVVVALRTYEGAWDAAREKREVPICLTRRIRQLNESKGNIRRWQRDLGALEAAIAAIEQNETKT